MLLDQGDPPGSFLDALIDLGNVEVQPGFLAALGMTWAGVFQRVGEDGEWPLIPQEEGFIEQ